MRRILKNEWVILFFILAFPLFFHFLELKSLSKIPLCFFHFLTGFDCPGCGMTRGMTCWFQGRWLQAIRYNALVPILFLIWIYYLSRSIFFLFKKRNLPSMNLFQRNTLSYYLFGILFWGQWIFKLSKQILGF